MRSSQACHLLSHLLMPYMLTGWPRSSPGPDFCTDSGRRSRSSSHSLHHCVTCLHIRACLSPALSIRASTHLGGALYTCMHACTCGPAGLMNVTQVSPETELLCADRGGQMCLCGRAETLVEPHLASFWSMVRLSSSRLAWRAAAACRKAVSVADSPSKDSSAACMTGGC